MLLVNWYVIQGRESASELTEDVGPTNLTVGKSTFSMSGYSSSSGVSFKEWRYRGRPFPKFSRHIIPKKRVVSIKVPDTQTITAKNGQRTKVHRKDVLRTSMSVKRNSQRNEPVRVKYSRPKTDEYQVHEQKCQKCFAHFQTDSEPTLLFSRRLSLTVIP